MPIATGSFTPAVCALALLFVLRPRLREALAVVRLPFVPAEESAACPAELNAALGFSPAARAGHPHAFSVSPRVSKYKRDNCHPVFTDWSLADLTGKSAEPTPAPERSLSRCELTVKTGTHTGRRGRLAKE